MKTTALQELHDLEKTYWWHVGRLEIIEQRLKKISGRNKKNNILNVGSGTGGTIASLEKFGKVQNVDVSKEAIAFLKRNGYKSQLVGNGPLPFKDRSYDIVTALDVLEHINQDDNALADWFRVLKPGGSLLITVPAYQWLWSQHDVINNHHRRYTRSKLETKVRKAGFKVNKASYAIVFSFPLVAGSRILAKVSRKKPNEYSSFVQLPKPINKLFINFLKFEARSGNVVSFPFGTSILIVASKPTK